MLNFGSFFERGLKGTLRLKNGVTFSHNAPWNIVYENTLIDEWFVGDFMAAEYTIVVDLNTTHKEVIKCLIVASPDLANITIYGRTNLGRELVELSVTVDDSRVRLIANPATSSDSTSNSGSKLVFSADYFNTVNELRA